MFMMILQGKYTIVAKLPSQTLVKIAAKKKKAVLVTNGEYFLK